MPVTQPTLAQLIERQQASIESRLPGSQPRLRRSVLGILARAVAEAAHGLYGYQAWIAQQILPDTAEGEILERHASVRNITRIAAVAAAGSVTLTGTNGAVISAATELQTADGLTYTTDAEATIASGSATVAVTASVAGAAGNQVAGVTLTLVSPIAGVNSQATVAAGGLAGGAEIEDDEALRERLLFDLRADPAYGSLTWYEAQARAAHPDVTRAWATAGEAGPGTVTVRVMTDDATVDGIPVQQVLDAVAALIDATRPPAAAVYVLAPVAVPLAMTIAIAPNTAAVQAAIQAELRDLLRREAAPGATILISHIDETISLAEGETDHNVVVPAGNVTHSASQIAVLGTITWQGL